jgi:hypothetical protein
MNKPTKFIFFLLCTLCSIPTSYAQSPQPSPQLLLSSWQQYVQDVNHALSSYRLRVNVTPDTPISPPTTLSPIYKQQVETVVSGQKFRVVFTNYSPNQKDEQEYAYSGRGFDAEETQFFSHQYRCSHHTGSESVSDYLTAIRESGMPIFLDDLLLVPNNDKTIIQSHSSLITYYQWRLANLKVIGTDKIGDWNCFHVQLHGPQPATLVLPQDLWFAPVGHYFFPVRVQTTMGDTQNVVIYTQGQQINGIWVPTEYRLETHFKTTYPSGRTDFSSRVVPSPIFHLTLSDINASFPESTFHIVCKQANASFTLSSIPFRQLVVLFAIFLFILVIATAFLRRKSALPRPPNG